MAQTVRTLTWQATVLTVAGLGFLAFALWLTAEKFNGSELKTLLIAAGGYAAREFGPILKQMLKAHGDAGALE